MPKASRLPSKSSKTKLGSEKTKVKVKPVQKTSASTSSQPQKLYSSFLPIPISFNLPTSIPSSSSSSKQINSVTHYIYVRPNISSSKGKNVDFPNDRTLFVSNIPVDIGSEGLRSIFWRFGPIERIAMGDNEKGDEMMENEIMDISDSDNEYDDEDDDDLKEDNENTTDGNKDKSGLKFMGDPTLNSKKRRKLNKKLSLQSEIPSVTALPSLNPRVDTYNLSGQSSAHIIFLSPQSLQNVLSHPTTSALIFKPSSQLLSSNPTGSEYYKSLHKSLRPAMNRVKEYSDTSMTRFDHLHSLLLSSRAKKSGAGALVDEDGFTMVVRGGRNGRTGGITDKSGKITSVGVASRGFDGMSSKNKEMVEQGKRKKKGGTGAGELMDFYKFQKMDRKKQELADLRSKFEDDKKKVEDMRKAKRFKPY